MLLLGWNKNLQPHGHLWNLFDIAALKQHQGDQRMDPVNTWMVSLALCLLCSEVGVKDTVMSLPAEPTGGKNPEEGVTVKSLLLPGRNAAVN